jgi:hypothetical protein
VELIEKLKQVGPDSPLAQLAKLSTQLWFETPLEQVISKEKLATHIHSVLKELSASDSVLKSVEQLIEHAVSMLGSNAKTVSAEIPKEFQVATEEIMGRPFSPNRALVVSVLDTKPMRELIRQLLSEAISDFTKRASAPVQSVAKGLGAFARLAQDTVKNRGGALGSLVGAMSEGVENQVEQRSAAFIDSAISKTLNQLADFISNPQHADESAEIRVALWQSILKLKVNQFSNELINLDVSGAGKIIQEQMGKWIKRSESRDDILQFIERGNPLFQKTVKELLESIGVYESVRGFADEYVEQEIRRVVATSGFEKWLLELVKK